MLTTYSAATRGAENVGSKDARIMLHEIGLTTGHMDATVGDKALKDERTTFTKQGKKEPGFASSAVPTLEEKVISENQDVQKLLDDQSSSDGRTADGQKYGAPADAAKNDTVPPHGAGSELSRAEKDAPAVRSLLRKNLTEAGPWTLPMPAPEIDPDGFEDPLADSFWKGMWLAAAVHNVRSAALVKEGRLTCLLWWCRPRSSARCSTQSLTTWSRHGSSTKSSSLITSDSTSRCVPNVLLS
jgi:phospholipase D1/2